MWALKIGDRLVLFQKKICIRSLPVTEQSDLSSKKLEVYFGMKNLGRMFLSSQPEEMLHSAKSDVPTQKSLKN